MKIKIDKYQITPVPKPRMTRRDKWLKPPRPCVARYWEFCDLVKANKIKLPESGSRISFFIPMPKSWSSRKKEDYYGEPHQSRPDLSNLLKALEDCLYKEDSHIWSYASIEKLWGYEGAIWVY